MLSSATQTINNHKHEQARKGDLQAFPDADSLPAVEGPWHPGIPRIRDTELMSASQTQSGATSATCMFCEPSFLGRR